MTTLTDAAAMAVTADTGVVNGPEDLGFSWDTVRWRQVEAQVRRLRQRIFTATREGDLKRVRNLQKLMLRSFANTLVSVRRVTEINAGRLTAGIDPKGVTTSRGKTGLVGWVHPQPQTLAAPPGQRRDFTQAHWKQRP